MPPYQSLVRCYIATSSLLIIEKRCLKTQSGTRPLTHNMHFEIILAQGESLWGHKTIDVILEERQVSKQIYGFFNID